MARLNDTATDTSARSNFKKQSSTFSLTARVTPEHAAADAVHQLDLTITSPYFQIFLYHFFVVKHKLLQVLYVFLITSSPMNFYMFPMLTPLPARFEN